MRLVCPCCGGPLDGGGLDLALLAEVPMPGQHRRILDALARSYPRSVSSASLFDALYFDRPDGGPDDPRNVIAVRVCQLRRRLAPHGWTIGLRAGGYGGYGGYLLVQAGAS